MSEPQSENLSFPIADDGMAVQGHDADTMESLKAELHARLVIASLRTEAVRAGMIDLDGLKLIDLSSVTLDEQDTVVDGPEFMRTLRKNKPWLFRTSSSSSASAAPSSRPMRQKSAMEMSEEEYIVARKALTTRY